MHLCRDINRDHIDRALLGNFKGGQSFVSITFSPKSGAIHGMVAWRRKPEQPKVLVDVASGVPRKNREDQRQGGYAQDFLSGVEAREQILGSWHLGVRLEPLGSRCNPFAPLEGIGSYSVLLQRGTLLIWPC